MRGSVLHVRLTGGGVEDWLDHRDFEVLPDVEDEAVDRFRVAPRRVPAYGRPGARR